MSSETRLLLDTRTAPCRRAPVRCRYNAAVLPPATLTNGSCSLPAYLNALDGAVCTPLRTLPPRHHVYLYLASCGTTLGLARFTLPRTADHVCALLPLRFPACLRRSCTRRAADAQQYGTLPTSRLTACTQTDSPFAARFCMTIYWLVERAGRQHCSPARTAISHLTAPVPHPPAGRGR